MHYATIKKTDVANGPGVRVSLFVSGCTHQCPGCFNQTAWDFSYGEEFTERTRQEILKALSPEYIRGFSVLGGEPLEEQNRETVLSIIKSVKEQFPKKDIWLYTGYTYETDVLRWRKEGNQTMAELISLVDVLVDGEFVGALKDLKLPFRGSSNQRLIDLKRTTQCGEVILYQG